MLGLTFSSTLNCGSYIISFAKFVSKKIRVLICSMKFSSPQVALYLYKSTLWPCMGRWSCLGMCFCQASETNMQDCWSFTCCLLWTIGSSLKCSQPKSFSIGIILVDVHLNWLYWFHLLIIARGLFVILID